MFLEYLYIPLGGNRRGQARTVINKFTVFLLCGLWHGAAWTFVVWGLLHGLFLMLEELVPIRRLPAAIRHAYTLLVVTLTIIVFRSESFGQALDMFARLFGLRGAAAQQAAAAQQVAPAPAPAVAPAPAPEPAPATVPQTGDSCLGDVALQ